MLSFRCCNILVDLRIATFVKRIWMLSFGCCSILEDFVFSVLGFRVIPPVCYAVGMSCME